MLIRCCLFCSLKVDCNDRACQGKGPNKKLAKRNAAEEMLQLMGYSQLSPSPGKSVLKSPDHSGNSSATHNKHVTFLDSTQINKVGLKILTYIILVHIRNLNTRSQY